MTAEQYRISVRLDDGDDGWRETQVVICATNRRAAVRTARRALREQLPDGEALIYGVEVIYRG